MNQDALLIDLRQVRAELRGISPKLSLYTVLKARETQILGKLGKKFVEEDEQKRSVAITKLRNVRCPMMYCPNFTAEKQSKDFYGFPRRHKLCDFHRKAEIQRKAIENNLRQRGILSYGTP